jgi:CRP-like cAMP-binding protein
MRAVLARFSPVPDDAWQAAVPFISARRVAAGEQVLRAGARATQVIFVAQGLLREYYTDAAGVEATRSFRQTGELSGSLADLLSDGPSVSSIEALDDSELWQLPWAQFDALTLDHPAWMLLARRFAEQLYLNKVRREFEMLTLPAAERYERFVAEQPELESRLPRYLVASYLGITPVHLSRVRASRAAGGTPQQSPAGKPERS